MGEDSLLDQKKLDLLARGDPGELNVHLSLIEKEIEIQGTKTKAYCHYLPPDANGKIGVARLAEFMRGCAIEYAIPREKIAQAKARDDKFGQSNALIALYEIAKQTFTHLKNSGEGGELLVFLFAERFLKLPQVLCKMDLKTAAGVHFHGCDGVYSLALSYDGVEHHLGTLELAHRATGIQKRIAFVAAAIGAEGGTLVYVNGAGTAETIAQLITDHLKATGQKPRAPRYLACYLDILRLHLKAIGKEGLLPEDLRLDLYLEFGVSTQTLLSLMSLGVSRMSAVELYGKMARDDMAPTECIAWVQENVDRLDMLQLPRSVVSEIRRKMIKDGETSHA